MSDVTVIGLGMMGQALATTLLASGQSVTAWNRSPEKSEKMASEGALLAQSVSAAIQASPVILICIKDYGTTLETIGSNQVLPHLKNRVFIQLSSGTPQDAINAESWFSDQGASYLDGAILGSPFTIGTDEGQIILSGDSRAWKKSQSSVDCLTGNLKYAGPKIESAKVLDLAFLVQRLSLFMGVFQGLLLCESAGLGLDIYESTIAPDRRIKLLADTIRNETFLEPINSIRLWKDALQHIQKQAKDTNTNSEVLDFIEDKFLRAQSAGIEEEDLAAIIKVLRS